MIIDRRLLFLGAPLMALLLWFYPSLLFFLERVPCAVKMMTGFDCPGCGFTRSLVYFIHGDIYRSIMMNPMGPVGLSILPVLFFAGANLFRVLVFLFVAGLFAQWFINIGLVLLFLV